MIQNGFTYITVLIFSSALLVNIPRILQGSAAKRFFQFIPPVVLIYIGLMTLCTSGFWDLQATASTYSALKNPLLYSMLFLMLLRCDLRKIFRLGPKMLIGFAAASLSIGLGFLICYFFLHDHLGSNSWEALGALCGSWMGGSGNMLAIQAALDIDESVMAYTLVIDTICGTFYIMFLLWVIGFADHFNRWVNADTNAIDAVGLSLEAESKSNKSPLLWQNIIFLLGLGLLVADLSQYAGTYISTLAPFFDKATWTVLIITLVGSLLAMTPAGKIKGTEEISTVLLYIVIALIASRADLSNMGNTFMWIIAGFLILIFHILIMLVFARIFHLDIFTCAVASLANIGGTATAPILAGSYNNSLVPVGIIMALLGYIIGTGGGLLVAELMHLIG